MCFTHLPLLLGKKGPAQHLQLLQRVVPMAMPGCLRRIWIEDNLLNTTHKLPLSFQFNMVNNKLSVECAIKVSSNKTWLASRDTQYLCPDDSGGVCHTLSAHPGVFQGGFSDHVYLTSASRSPSDGKTGLYDDIAGSHYHCVDQIAVWETAVLQFWR